jgi:hypothetical protein
LPDLIISDVVRDAKILENLLEMKLVEFLKNNDIERISKTKGNNQLLNMFSGLDI